MSDDANRSYGRINANRVGKDNHPDQVLIRTPEWMDQALCVGAYDDAFPRTKNAARSFIRRYCAGCPVVAECAAWAVKHNVQYGVYGGEVVGRDYLGDAA